MKLGGANTLSWAGVSKGDATEIVNSKKIGKRQNSKGFKEAHRKRDLRCCSWGVTGVLLLTEKWKGRGKWEIGGEKGRFFRGGEKEGSTSEAKRGIMEEKANQAPK